MSGLLQSIHCKPEKQIYRCQSHCSLYTVNLKNRDTGVRVTADTSIHCKPEKQRYMCQGRCSLYTVNLKNRDTGVRITAVYTL